MSSLIISVNGVHSKTPRSGYFKKLKLIRPDRNMYVWYVYPGYDVMSLKPQNW